MAHKPPILKESSIVEGLNPEQTEAVLAPKTTGVQVIAGAGTGKTKLMAHRFVRLVDELTRSGVPQAQERILAVTFTVKAAQEMRQRVNALLEAHHFSPLSASSYLTNFHGFCHRLLRRHGLSIGLSPSFAILGGLEKTLFLDQLLNRIRHGYYDDLSEPLAWSGLGQMIAPDILSLKHLGSLPTGSLGSGGLDAVIGQIPDILDQIKRTGQSPSQFIEMALGQTSALTETLKTLPQHIQPGNRPVETNAELCELWTNHFVPWADDQWSFRGAAFDQQQFFEKQARAGKTVDETHLESFYKERLSWLNFNFQRVVGPEKVRPFYHQFRKKMTPGDGNLSFLDGVFEEEKIWIHWVTAVYTLYQYELHRYDACDFDDLINRTLELFDRRPDLQRYYQNYFESIIVDEFQDSNGSQLQLIRRLMKPDVTNLTVVGDLKQSIYGFRHAQPENMDLIFEGRQCQKIRLHMNYRSTPSVIAAANPLAVDITNDPKQAFEPSPHKQADVQLGVDGVRWVELGLEDPETGKPETIQELREKEAMWIAVETARMLLDPANTFEPKDIAVLVKSHQKAKVIEHALSQLGIPAVTQKNQGFFNEPVILDAIAVLKLLNHPHHDLAWVRILQGKLNQRQLRLLAAERHQLKLPWASFIEGLSDSQICPEISVELRAALVNLAQELTGTRKRLVKANLIGAYFDLLDRLGLVSADEEPIVQLEKRRHLRVLKRLLYQFVCDSAIQPSLTDILDTLTHYQNDPKLEIPSALEDSEDNAVRVMTIHVAKGLEFPVVFVAYTESQSNGTDGTVLVFDPQYQGGGNGKAGYGLFLTRHPSGISGSANHATLKKLLHQHVWEKPRKLAEEKRLFYVALTRAERSLIVVRGATSPPWTSAHEVFPGSLPPGVSSYQESDDPEHFQESYWDQYDDVLEGKMRSHLDQTVMQVNQPVVEKVLNPLPDDSGVSDIPKFALKLSYSAIQSFERCHTQYWFKHVWRMPVLDETTTQVGRCFHKLVEIYYAYQGQLEPERVQRFLSRELPDSQGDRDKVIAMYDHFLRSPLTVQSLGKNYDNIESERWLRFPVLEEQPSSPVVMTGQIDLLLQNSETVELIDFKTDAYLNDSKIKHYARQLALYRYGLERTWLKGDQRNIIYKLAHVTPEGLELVGMGDQNTEPMIQELQGQILGIQQLHDSDMLPKRQSDAMDCRRCAYNAICPNAQP